MATTARRRGPSAVQRGGSFPGGVTQRLMAIWRGFRTSPPDLIGTPRFRREFAGVVLVLLAMLSAYVIGRGGDEGRFVAFLPASEAEKALELLRQHPVTEGATLIGHVADAPQSTVVLRSRIGSNRIVDMLSGEQLPRIC